MTYRVKFECNNTPITVTFSTYGDLGSRMSDEDVDEALMIAIN